MRQNYTIPDHSPAALAEAYETALFSLAFQKMEEEELEMMRQKIKTQSKPNNRQARFAQRLQRELRRERNRALLKYALPRIAQAAACLITVISIGAGVALAASQEVRSWAAGVLTGTPLEEETQFFGEAFYERIEDGTVLGDQLVLMESDGELFVRGATAEEPVRYVWADQDSRRLCRLEACGGEIYALYEIGHRDDSFFEEEPDVGAVNGAWGSFDRVGLGRLRFGENGTFAVEELASFDAKSLFDPQGREAANGSLNRIAAGGGKLYFTTVCDVSTGEFSFGGERIERLFACDLTTGELTELPSPLEGVASPGYRLFSDETVFVGVENPMRIFRIEDDGSYAPMAEFAMGEGANSYAYRASTDTFYYQMGAAVYAAEHFDIANAKRVALSGGNGGRGFLIGENSYGIILFNGVAEIFDFDVVPSNEIELVVGGHLGPFMDDSLRALYPNLTLVSDPADDHDGTYVDKLLAGEIKADVISLFYDEYAAVARAGWGAPITDPDVREVIANMAPGLRNYVSCDGEWIALPESIWAVNVDLVINRDLWLEMGFAEEDMPETWLELFTFLRDLSRSGRTSGYNIRIGDWDMTPLQLLTARVVEGFARSWAARGIAPDFGGEDFRQALDALREIDFDALPCDFALNSADLEHQLLSFRTDYGPTSVSEERVCRVLGIRAEEPRFASSGGYFLLVNPKSENKEMAYNYMRWRLDGIYAAMEQPKLNFAAPAEKLVGDMYGLTKDKIEKYREDVGDIFVDCWGEKEFSAMMTAFSAYARGEIEFAALAATLNEIYAL